MKNEKSINLPVRWVFPENLQPQFSDNSVIQFSPQNQEADHFVLSFFRMNPPIITDEIPVEERKNVLMKLGGINANCVAQIILTPQQVRKLIASLTKNLEKFDKTTKAQEK